MQNEHRCIFCKTSKFGKRVVIDERLPFTVTRTLECPDCGKELENARSEFKLFGDPVPIGFDPVNASDEKEEGYTIREVFEDPIARTLWLGLGSHYLKDQHFRRCQINTAEGFREYPPKIFSDFRSRLNICSSWMMFSRVDEDIARALYPYVIFELMAENRWPCFVTTRLPQRGLQWVYVKPEKDKMTGFEFKSKGIPASIRKPPIRTIVLE